MASESSGSATSTLDLLRREDTVVQTLFLDFEDFKGSDVDSRYHRGLVVKALSHRLAVREAAKRFLAEALADKLGRDDLAEAVSGDRHTRLGLIEKLYLQCAGVEAAGLGNDVAAMVKELAAFVKPEITVEIEEVVPKIVAEVGERALARVTPKPSYVRRHAPQRPPSGGEWYERFSFLEPIKTLFDYLRQKPDARPHVKLTARHIAGGAFGQEADSRGRPKQETDSLDKPQ